jgi:hypothetical protein
MTWKQTMAGKSKTSYVIGFHSSGNIHEYNFKTCQPQRLNFNYMIVLKILKGKQINFPTNSIYVLKNCRSQGRRCTKFAVFRKLKQIHGK